MKRTGSIASRVPPAVTTMCRPVEVGVAGRLDERWPRGRIRRRGPAVRRRPRRRRRRSRSSSARRPTPDLARGERARVGLDDRVAERPQPGDVGDASPGASTCRRPSPGRRRPAPTSPGTSRSRRRRPGRWPSRRASARSRARRRSRRPLSADDDVPDPAVGQQVEQVGLDRVARQRRERQRADEPRRGRGQHHRDVGALGAQQAQQLDRLVGGDRARSRRARSDGRRGVRARLVVTSAPARAARRRRPRRGGWPGP